MNDAQLNMLRSLQHDVVNINKLIQYVDNISIKAQLVSALFIMEEKIKYLLGNQ